MKKLNVLVQKAAPDLLSRLIEMQARAARIFGPHGRSAVPHDEVRQVLVVDLFEIGDVVMLSPFLRELRRLLPAARITLVVKPEIKNLVETCPHVSEVLTYEANYRPLWRPLILPWQAFWTMRRWRRTRQFDLALVPSWQVDNSYMSFLAYFSGAGRRIGYSETVSPRRRCLNRGSDQLFTETLSCDGVEHEVERNLAVLSLLGGNAEHKENAEHKMLELWTAPEDDAFARDFWAVHGGGRPVFALCPTAGHSVLKQWPLENFVALAGRLHEKNVRVLVVGGPGDRALGESFEAAFGDGVINAVGKTTLRQMAALLRGCAGFVGNDAGPMHIAAAAGVPVAAIFGSSCPHRFGPWGPKHLVISHELPCSPCGRGHDAERCVRCIFPEPRCLTGITVDEALRSVLSLLSHLSSEVPYGAEPVR